jgi:hypothetical protein
MNMRRVLFLITKEIGDLKIKAMTFSIRKYKKIIMLKTRGRKESSMQIIFNKFKKTKFNI